MSHLYDRSRTTTDWQCPRKRWYQYEFGGKGIVSGNTSLELYMGSCIHDGLAALAQFQSRGDEVDIEAIAGAAHTQMRQALLQNSAGLQEEYEFAAEQAALVEGLLRGFYKHVWPRLLDEYPTILFIEEEMEFVHDGLTFMSRPDLIVADRDGTPTYIEYKSTSSKKEGWVNSWNTAVQLHSTIKAVEATKGVKIEKVIVQGLYKGYESYGKQNSPFCYAYRRTGNPPFTTDDVRYDYAPGYRRSPTWEMAGGVAAWVDAMPEQMLADQFPQAPPIQVKEDIVANFFSQRSYREHEIILATSMLKEGVDYPEEVLNATFPQRFDQCRPYFGKACSYLPLCHGPERDPLTMGFIYREPHHELEKAQFDQVTSGDNL